MNMNGPQQNRYPDTGAPRMQQNRPAQGQTPPAARRSMYDIPQRNGNVSSANRARNASQAGNPPRPGAPRPQNTVRRNPNGTPPRNSGTPAQRQNLPSGSGMYNVNAAQRQRLARMQEEARRRNQARTGQPYAPAENASAPLRTSAAQQTDTANYGTRVTSAPDGGRYGNHSSYRTADGRILDGFDKNGRPIYREADAENPGVVVHRAAFTPDTMRRLHPTRRVRVETLADTEVKPFPWKIVLVILFCTALSMAVLYTYMELNECTNSISTLTYRLSSLRNTYNTLSAELVQREDLIAIEETASSTLGMVKNDILTKRYVSIENEDKTELVIKAAEAAKRRTSVEIDLSTGKPRSSSVTEEEAEADPSVPS